MPTPQNSVFETFTGTNHTLIADHDARWTQVSASGSLKLLDNKIRNTLINTSAIALWNETAFGADCEAFVTITAKASTNEAGCIVRATTLTEGTMDGYLGVAEFVSGSSDMLKIYRIDNGVTTQIGTTHYREIFIGDHIWLEARGDTLNLYHNYVLRVTATDNTYPSAGYIGFQLYNDCRFDNFGGGTLSTASNQSVNADLVTATASTFNPTTAVAVTTNLINTSTNVYDLAGDPITRQLSDYAAPSFEILPIQGSPHVPLDLVKVYLTANLTYLKVTRFLKVFNIVKTLDYNIAPEYDTKDSIIAQMRPPGQAILPRIRPNYPLLSQQIDDIFMGMQSDLNYIITSDPFSASAIGIADSEKSTAAKDITSGKTEAPDALPDHTRDWRKL
jgi:hypothetical protein